MPATTDGLPILIDAIAGRANGVFTATVSWRLHVKLNGSETLIDLLPDRVAFLFSLHLPLEGSPYPFVPLATCRAVDCKRESNTVYLFTAKYSDENSTSDRPGTDNNPLNDRPIIKPVAGMKQLAITRDRDNKGILNKAGDPIVQSMDDNFIGFSITANIVSVPDRLGALRNTCNSGPITVAGLPIAAEVARFVLPSGWLSTIKNRNDTNYYEFSYELLLDEHDKHYGTPMNAGFRQLVDLGGGDKKQFTITMEDGSEPSAPVPLTTDGEWLADPTPDNTNFLEIKKYPTADYTVLPGISK